MKEHTLPELEAAYKRGQRDGYALDRQLTPKEVAHGAAGWQQMHLPTGCHCQIAPEISRRRSALIDLLCL